MQWQMSLMLLGQPAFSEDAVREKMRVVDEAMDVLSGDPRVNEEMDDADTLALLQMAGRMPIRKFHASTSGDDS